MFRHFASCSAAAVAALGLAGAGTSVLADAQAAAEQLSIEKLACHRNVPPPRAPVVLVSCGSFNPPTVMHLRMFDLATAALAERGYDVWGCYMSPVADQYGKKGLAPVQHRLEMCRLAAAGTGNVMVDAWEATQPGYTRTLQVLQHVHSSLQAYMQPQPAQDAPGQEGSRDASTVPSSSSSTPDAIHAHGLAAAAATAANLSAKAEPPAAAAAAAAAAAPTPAATASTSSSTRPGDGDQPAAAARVMLLCGADLLATMNKPGVWKDPGVILQEHGVVCICRAGTDVGALFEQPDCVLGSHKDKVMVVEEPVQNTVSSSLVRWLLAHGSPVRYLVPDAVLAYIQQHRLYSTNTEAAAGVLHG